MKKAIILIVLLCTLSMTTGCAASNSQRGAGIGALGGAVIGAYFSEAKLVGAAVGGLAGLVLGNIAGSKLDDYDRDHIVKASQETKAKKYATWKNPVSRETFKILVMPSYTKSKDDPLEYRDLKVSRAGGETFILTVCRKVKEKTWMLT